MRTSIIVLALVAALVLLTASAWAADSMENWENWAAYPGAVWHQASGSGWGGNNANWWNGADPTNPGGKYNNVLQPDGIGTNQFLANYGTSTGEANRTFNEAFYTASNLWVCFDYTIQGAFIGDATVYVRGNTGTTSAAQIEFKANATKDINYRGPTTILLGHWDGTNVDFTANNNLNFAAGWRHLCFKINEPAQTWSAYATANPLSGNWTTLFTDYAFRNAVTQVNTIAFYGGKTNYTDPDYGYTGIDNIHLTLSDTNPCVPEPSSLLAFATGLIGLAGMTIRRRR